MPTTIEADNRLKGIRVSGSSMAAELRDICLSAKLSIGSDKVSEMSFDFLDTMDLSVFRSKIFSKGATLVYGDWHFTSEGVDLAPGAAGPVLSVTAPSKFVTALRGQTGAANWGDVDVSQWVESVAKSVGMSYLVQPGLGVKSIMRQAPEDGGNAESTWDVLTALKGESGVWLFEYGTTLVFAKPSFLLATPWSRRIWSLNWDSWLGAKTEGLVGMPSYSTDPTSETPETLTLELVSADADQARPGDEVSLSGASVGEMGGRWIIKSVDFPLNVAGKIKLTCQRPIDPKIVPRQTAAETTSGGGGKAASSGASAASGVGGAVDRWVASVQGKAVDMDGAFGAQCVDLARSYSQNVVGTGPVMGNGNQWFANGAATGAYTQVGAGSPAAKGDIACWGSFYGGGYGHVAIVLEDRGGSVNVMSQNPGPARPMELSKQGLQGYLRPKRVN